MTKFATSSSAIAIMLGVLLHAGAAGATSARTWVSGATGLDSNPCTRSAPCATFSQALSQTTPGGEIDVLDGGEFGQVSIVHSITIANDGVGVATITPASGRNGVNVTTAPSDAVVLRGLTINGINAGPATEGIEATGEGSLLVDHCLIKGFQGSGGGGVLLAPQFTGNGSLSMKDTVLANDGASNGASLLIQPTSGLTATAELERVQILNAIGNGVRVDGSFGGAADVELHDVTVDAASGGSAIVALSPTSGGPTAKLLADHVTSSHNVGYGFRAVGGTASVYLRGSTIDSDGVGLGASSGGQIFSYGDNSLANNTSGNGVTPTAVASE
jgi:hypothetical protein